MGHQKTNAPARNRGALQIDPLEGETNPEISHSGPTAQVLSDRAGAARRRQSRAQRATLSAGSIPVATLQEGERDQLRVVIVPGETPRVEVQRFQWNGVDFSEVNWLKVRPASLEGLARALREAQQMIQI